jgi:hypothetical protein
MKDWIRAPGAHLRAAARRVGLLPNGFAPTRHVWSRGLALLCEHHGGLPFVRQQPQREQPLCSFDLDDYAQVRDGDLVWTRSTALPEFVARALPRIQARFALLTGDEDWSIPSEFDGAEALLNDDRLVCWYAQNLDRGGHAKLHALPIGLDFHTISFGRRWGHVQATPQEQEAELEAMQQGMLPKEQRWLRVHADFHFNRHSREFGGEARERVEALLRRNPLVDFESRKRPRSELWRHRARYAFVVSPHGHGLDCHRTWESLALGNIVIVRSSVLDPLYEGLPVVIVQNWEEITPDNLAAWHTQHAGSFARPGMRERLTNSYWIERVRRTFAQLTAHREICPEDGRQELMVRG